MICGTIFILIQTQPAAPKEEDSHGEHSSEELSWVAHFTPHNKPRTGLLVRVFIVVSYCPKKEQECGPYDHIAQGCRDECLLAQKASHHQTTIQKEEEWTITWTHSYKRTTSSVCPHMMSWEWRRISKTAGGCFWIRISYNNTNVLWAFDVFEKLLCIKTWYW